MSLDAPYLKPDPRRAKPGAPHVKADPLSLKPDQETHQA
jgi:hypothetical protein